MILRSRFKGTQVETDIEVPDTVRILYTKPWWVPGKFYGITLGTRKHPRIHFRDNPPDPRTVWHELRHVEQLIERGAPRYFIAWLWDTVLFSYSGNRMEEEADRVADERYRAYVATHGRPR